MTRGWTTAAVVVGLLAPSQPAAWAQDAEASPLPDSVLAAQRAEALEPRWIRVAVAQREPQVDLAVNGRFELFGLSTDASVGQHRRLRSTTVKAVPTGILFGEDVLPGSGVRIQPARDATIHVNGQRLRGTVEIRKRPDQTLLVVNRVSLEDYLKGVLSKEAPHYWPMESLKAIAIAARTYSVFQRLTKTDVEFDVTGDVLSQVYGGKSSERGPTSRAVAQTRGQILLYQGRVFPAFYHSTCGGRTEHGSAMGPFDLEPLQGNVICTFCQASPFYRWQRKLSFADTSWALKQQGRSIWPVTRVSIVQRTLGGRVAKLRVDGRASVTLTGHEFRQLFGFESLRSTAFTIMPTNDGVILNGQGWGHGVGLCQWGAAELARRELSAEEILAFYYPHATLASIDDVVLEPIPTPKGAEPAHPCRRGVLCAEGTQGAP